MHKHTSKLYTKNGCKNVDWEIKLSGKQEPRQFPRATQYWTPITKNDKHTHIVGKVGFLSQESAF